MVQLYHYLCFSDVQRNGGVPLQLLSEAVQASVRHGQCVRGHEELVRGSSGKVDHTVPGGLQQVRVRWGTLLQGGRLLEIARRGAVEPAQIPVDKDVEVKRPAQPVRPSAGRAREDGRHDGTARTKSRGLPGELRAGPRVQRVHPEEERSSGPMFRLQLRLLQQQQGAGEARDLRRLRDEGGEAEARSSQR